MLSFARHGRFPVSNLVDLYRYSFTITDSFTFDLMLCLVYSNIIVVITASRIGRKNAESEKLRE